MTGGKKGRIEEVKAKEQRKERGIVSALTRSLFYLFAVPAGVVHAVGTCGVCRSDWKRRCCTWNYATVISSNRPHWIRQALLSLLSIYICIMRVVPS